MELLWPGEDSGKLSNRLSVALATLRGVLGPEVLGAGQTGAVAVDLEVVDVDVERFLRAEPGEALALYRGDFLEEDLYEDWAADLRDQARAAYAAAGRGRLAEGGDRRRGGPALPAAARAGPLGRRARTWALIARLEADGRHGEAGSADGGSTRPPWKRSAAQTLRPLERLWSTVGARLFRSSPHLPSSCGLRSHAPLTRPRLPARLERLRHARLRGRRGSARLRQALRQADLARRDPPPGGQPEAPHRLAVRVNNGGPGNCGRRLRAPRRRGRSTRPRCSHASTSSGWIRAASAPARPCAAGLPPPRPPRPSPSATTRSGRSRDAQAEFGRNCRAHSGELLDHLSSANVARDLDRLRAGGRRRGSG